MEYLKNLREKVLYVLENFPDTRNDDAILTFHIIYTYLPDEMLNEKGKWYISTNALKRVREDHVKRIRADIQNGNPRKNIPGRFLPSSEAIRRQRRISEEAWRNFLR